MSKSKRKDMEPEVHDQITDHIPNESEPNEVLALVDRIAQRQIDFERQAIEKYNEIVSMLKSVRTEIQATNPVAESNTMMQTRSNVDPDGINWGNSNHVKKDEFSNNKDMNILSKLGIDANTAAALAGKVLDTLNKPQGGGIGQMFQEFMIRDFFENYQRQKLESRAFMNMFVKKGLLSGDDVEVLRKNTDVLNDPLNHVIDSMKGLASSKN